MGIFSFGKKERQQASVNWVRLTSAEELDNLVAQSGEKPVMLFKHSTRCSISAMALNRLESYWESDIDVVPVYLDLLAYRPISNAIAERFNVVHQSPQLLLIKDGVCTYTSSHNQIDVEDLKEAL